MYVVATIWLLVYALVLPSLWPGLTARFTDWQLFVVGSFLLTTFQFFASCYLLAWLEWSWRPGWFLRYKLQPNKGPTGWKDPQVARAAWVALRNMLLGGAFNVAIFGLWRGSAFGPLPSLSELFFHLVVFYFCEEFFFYYSHRAFHSNLLYGPFHKLHHEFKAPVAIATIYAHPLEHIVANLWPLVSGPLLMGSHLAIIWFWFTFALMSTTHAHSGFSLPGFTENHHDLHHYAFRVNFGLGLLDRLHGTWANSAAELEKE